MPCFGRSPRWAGARSRHATRPDAPAEARADQALETSFVRIELDGTGAFTRLYDKRLKRELLLPGARGNRLMAFEDRPASWDSWNIDMYYEEHAYDVDGDTTVSPVTAARCMKA